MGLTSLFQKFKEWFRNKAARAVEENSYAWCYWYIRILRVNPNKAATAIGANTIEKIMKLVLRTVHLFPLFQRPRNRLKLSPETAVDIIIKVLAECKVSVRPLEGVLECIPTSIISSDDFLFKLDEKLKSAVLKNVFMQDVFQKVVYVLDDPTVEGPITCVLRHILQAMIYCTDIGGKIRLFPSFLDLEHSAKYLIMRCSNALQQIEAALTAEARADGYNLTLGRLRRHVRVLAAEDFFARANSMSESIATAVIEDWGKNARTYQFGRVLAEVQEISDTALAAGQKRSNFDTTVRSFYSDFCRSLFEVVPECINPAEAVIKLMSGLNHVAEGRKSMTKCFSAADGFAQLLNKNTVVANDVLKMVVLSEQPQSEKTKMLVELICKGGTASAWIRNALTKLCEEPGTSEMTMATVEDVYSSMPSSSHTVTAEVDKLVLDVFTKNFDPKYLSQLEIAVARLARDSAKFVFGCIESLLEENTEYAMKLLLTLSGQFSSAIPEDILQDIQSMLGKIVEIQPGSVLSSDGLQLLECAAKTETEYSTSIASRLRGSKELVEKFIGFVSASPPRLSSAFACRGLAQETIEMALSKSRSKELAQEESRGPIIACFVNQYECNENAKECLKTVFESQKLDIDHDFFIRVLLELSKKKNLSRVLLKDIFSIGWGTSGVNIQDISDFMCAHSGAGIGRGQLQLIFALTEFVKIPIENLLEPLCDSLRAYRPINNKAMFALLDIARFEISERKGEPLKLVPRILDCLPEWQGIGFSFKENEFTNFISLLDSVVTIESLDAERPLTVQISRFLMKELENGYASPLSRKEIVGLTLNVIPKCDGETRNAISRMLLKIISANRSCLDDLLERIKQVTVQITEAKIDVLPEYAPILCEIFLCSNNTFKGVGRSLNPYEIITEIVCLLKASVESTNDTVQRQGQEIVSKICKVMSTWPDICPTCAVTFMCCLAKVSEEFIRADDCMNHMIKLANCVYSTTPGTIQLDQKNLCVKILSDYIYEKAIVQSRPESIELLRSKVELMCQSLKGLVLHCISDNIKSLEPQQRARWRECIDAEGVKLSATFSPDI